MATYTVQDTKTGKNVTFEWNGETEPTDSDFEEVFSAARAETPQLPSAPSPMSMGDMASQAVSNIPSSTGNLIKNIANAAVHPIDTAKSLYNLAGSAADLAIPGEHGNEDLARNVGKFFNDRYGGKDEIMHSIANDPAGVLADLSAVLTGAGGAVKAAGTLAKAPTVAKVGNAVLDAGRAVEPFRAPATAVKAVKAMTPAPVRNTVASGAKTIKDFVVPQLLQDTFSPQSLYASAMKFSNNPKVLTPLERRQAINTGLEGGYLPNEGSYNRLWDNVRENKSKVNNIIEEGARNGDAIPTAEVTRLLAPLEKRAALVEKFNPEFAQVLKEARGSLESYGDNIPVANAQALKETLQDLSKYGVDDRSRFTVAANKAAARGIRIQLESLYPDLKALNKSSSSLLTLENELAKATGRVGNRDVFSLGMTVALGGSGGAGKLANVTQSLLNMPNIKARLALALYEGRTGTKLPLSGWKKAANAVFGPENRAAMNQAGRINEIDESNP